MMLFKLSVSNIRRSLRDYAIYFFTLVIGVSIFYVFNAIGTQASYLQLESDTTDVIDLLKSMLSGVSVFVAVILGLLVVYASRFLMKRRNREFALYLTLGMGKWKISAILLVETVIIGIGSLVVGLFAGIGLSQFTSALVANLFEADMTKFRFTLSKEAVLKTIFYFTIMYLVSMLWNTLMVSRLKLIELMQSGKKSEQIKLKNPVLCVLIFLVSVGLLGYAYYQVGWVTKNIDQNKMYIYIATGCVTTFLIFWSVSGMLLRTVMSVKKFYYKGLNSFTFRQISSKINTMVFSMTVICLMLFVTICTLASSFSIRNSMNRTIVSSCPADFEISYNVSLSEKTSGKSIPPENLEYGLADVYAESGIDMTENFRDYFGFRSYFDENLNAENIFGSTLEQVREDLEQVREEYPFIDLTGGEEVVRLSDYNGLMKLYGKKEVSLKDDEYAIVCDFKSMATVWEIPLNAGVEIEVFGKNLKPSGKKCVDGFIDISAQHINAGFYLVPDKIVDETCTAEDYFRDYFMGNYEADTEEQAKQIDKKVLERFNTAMGNWSEKHPEIIFYNSFETKLDIKANSVSLSAVVTFIGLYIGIVFLIMCGVILALKELSESVDSVRRYEMLRKIGVEEKDITKSLFRQTGIFFLIPLLLACVHSVFGMKFAAFFLELVGTENMTSSIIATSVIILLIYGGYFLITYFCGKNIIKDRR